MIFIRVTAYLYREIPAHFLRDFIFEFIYMSCSYCFIITDVFKKYSCEHVINPCESFFSDIHEEQDPHSKYNSLSVLLSEVFCMYF